MYRISAIFLFLYAGIAPTHAQTSGMTSIAKTGVVSGIVTDSSGALIAGATVTIKPTGNEAAYTATSGRDGRFTISNLIPGSYEVIAEQSGFNRIYKTLKLTAGQTAEMPLTLAINLVNQSVNVTAQTLAVTEMPSAQTITSVDRQDTKDSADFTIQESLALVPGVTTLTGNGPRDISISVRGSNDRQAFGIRNVQLFEDGFPVTQPDGLGRSDLTDPHAYDSIDAVQGPSSTLYGNYATGGAVLFHTRPGGDIHGVDLGTDVGSFGYLNNYVNIGNASDKYQYSVFLSNARAKQFMDHFSFNTITVNIFGQVSLTKHDRVAFKFINNDLDTQLPIRLSLIQYNNNPYQSGCANYSATNPGNNCATVSLFINGSTGSKVSESADEAGLGRHDRRTVTGVRWEHDLNDSTTLRTQFVWDNRDINQPTGASSSRGTYPSFNVISDVTRKAKALGGQSTTFAGGFFNYENISSYSYNVMPGGNATLGAQTATTFAAHLNTGFRVHEELAFERHWTAVAGFAGEFTRLTALDTIYAYSATASPSITMIPADRTFFNIAPEASVLYRPTDNLRVHARLGTGYGTPQATNLFITAAGGYGNNTQLQTQKNVGIDLGADWFLANNIQLSLTGFYERYSNELVSQSAGVNTVGSYTFNAPSSAHRGLVAGFDWHPLPNMLSGLRFRTAYQFDAQVYRTYTEQLSAGSITPAPAALPACPFLVTAVSGGPAACTAFVRNGNRIPGVIPQNLNARLIYDKPSGRYGNFGTYLESNFRDTFWLDNANQLQAPSVFLLNFDIHYDPAPGHGIWSRTHFYFDLQNLANRVYVASAGNITDSINSTTGLQNTAYGVTSVSTTTGSIYAGTPRSSIGGFRVKF